MFFRFPSGPTYLNTHARLTPRTCRYKLPPSACQPSRKDLRATAASRPGCLRFISNAPILYAIV
jgi:hypothetical protein